MQIFFARIARQPPFGCAYRSRVQRFSCCEEEDMPKEEQIPALLDARDPFSYMAIKKRVSAAYPFGLQ